MDLWRRQTSSVEDNRGVLSVLQLTQSTFLAGSTVAVTPFCLLTMFTLASSFSIAHRSFPFCSRSLTGCVPRQRRQAPAFCRRPFSEVTLGGPLIGTAGRDRWSIPCG